MTYRVRVRSVALQELTEATDWYSARSPQAVRRFLATIEATLDRLARDAGRFPVLHLDIRRVTVPGFPYGIYYRILGSECHVIALLHARRHPRRWQRR